MEVAGEEGYLADVGSSRQSCRPAFQPDGESAMRRHAMSEGLQVAGIRFDIGVT